jgi:hypothetical protein
MKLDFLIVTVLLISSAAYAGSQQWVKPTDITGKVPVRVKQISSLIEKITQNVVSCVGSGKDREGCICKQKSRNDKLRILYKKIVEKHPKWADSAVSYREGGVQHVVSFLGIKLQLHQYDEVCK